MTSTPFHVIDNPDALRHRVRGVRKGHYRALFIVGDGGVGKSSMIEEELGRDDEDNPPDDGIGTFWKEGRLSPVKLYAWAYRFRNHTLVLDDLPDISGNLPLASLLRQLTDTRDVRTVSWDTQNRELEARGIPLSFKTTSRIVLITNRWFNSKNPEVQALETRAPILFYDPSPEVIHRQAKEFGFDPVVYKYIGDAIESGRVHRLNFRDYRNASDSRANNDPWKTHLELRFQPASLDVFEDSDEHYVLAWATKHQREFCVAEFCRATTRFKDRREDLANTLKVLAKRGDLVQVDKKSDQVRRGRPSQPRYILRDLDRPRPKVRSRELVTN